MVAFLDLRVLWFSYGCLRQADGWGWLQGLASTTAVVQLGGTGPPKQLSVSPGFCCRSADKRGLAPGPAASSDNTCTGTLVWGLASRKPGATLEGDSCWQRLPLSGKGWLPGAGAAFKGTGPGQHELPSGGGGSHFQGQSEWYGWGGPQRNSALGPSTWC